MVLQTVVLTILAYLELFLLRREWSGQFQPEAVLARLRETPVAFLLNEGQWAALCLIIAVCAVAISGFVTGRRDSGAARIAGPVLSAVLTLGFVLAFAKLVKALVFAA